MTTTSEKAYQYTPATCPICKGRPLPTLKIGKVRCNLCGNQGANYRDQT